jgi:hypothetical protein
MTLQTPAARRPGAVARRVGIAVAMTVGAIATTAANAPASVSTGPQHGCGTIGVPARPWTSTVPDASAQRGDHWIVWWEGRRGSCKFAKSQATQLVRTVTTRQAQRGLFHWHGGTCVSQTERAHETIAPFWKTGCNLAYRFGGNTYHPVVYVMVDPDPRHIH